MLVEAVDVLGPALAGDDAVDDPVHPAHALAARRALAAGLVVVEAQHHLQQPHHARALGDHDHAARTQRRAGRVERLVVERQRLDLGAGQHLGGDAARESRLQLRAAEHAAAVLEQELASSGSRTRPRTRPARRCGRRWTRAACRGTWPCRPCLYASRALGDDPGDVGQRLDVVDDRRALVEALHGQARRAVARVAALALDRGEQPGRLAADVRPGAAIDDDVAGRSRCPGCARRSSRPRRLPRRARGEAAVRQVEFAADVDERVAHLQRVGRDQHRLEQQVRRVLEDPAVLERAGLALVGIGAQVMRLAVVELTTRPLASGRERRAAVAQQAGRRDFLASRPAGFICVSALAQRRIAAARAVVRERVRRRRDREVISSCLPGI